MTMSMLGCGPWNWPALSGGCRGAAWLRARLDELAMAELRVIIDDGVDTAYDPAAMLELARLYEGLGDDESRERSEERFSRNAESDH